MILDIIVIAFVLLGAFLGYKKGLVGVAISLISIILSIVLGLLFNGVIANGIYNDTTLGKGIEQTIYNGINTTLNTNETDETEAENNMYENLVNSIVGPAKDALTNEQLAKTITMYILKGMSFIIIFVAVFVICYILQMVLNLVFDLPILHSVNQIGGIAAGVIKAVIKVYIVLAIISFLEPMSILEPVINYINSSAVTSFLYHNNVFVFLIKSGIKI